MSSCGFKIPLLGRAMIRCSSHQPGKLFVSSYSMPVKLSIPSRKLQLTHRLFHISRRLSASAIDGGITSNQQEAPSTLNNCASSPKAVNSSNNNTSSATKVSDLSMLEIRVGKIVEIARHPEADSLYVEKVDVGEATGARTIVSGLVAFCKEEELLNRKVIVLCNLKPRSLKGITSHGMLLCASNTDHTAVVPITPPTDTPVGQLITFDGHPSVYVEPGNKATKAFSKIAEDFFVDDNGVATFKGSPFLTPQGPITSSLKGKIS